MESVECEEVHLDKLGAGLGIPMELIDEVNALSLRRVRKYESEVRICTNLSREDGRVFFKRLSGHHDAGASLLQEELDVVKVRNREARATFREMLSDEVDGFLNFFTGVFFVGEDEYHERALFVDIYEEALEIPPTDDCLVLEFRSVDEGRMGGKLFAIHDDIDGNFHPIGGAM